MEMDFIKTLKGCHITVIPELPPKGIRVDIDTMVAVPDIKQGKINLYSLIDDDWVLISTIDLANFDQKDLKEACDDLENAIKKLNKVISRTKDDEVSSKLSKITSKILQAKYELIDDVVSLKTREEEKYGREFRRFERRN